jgi:hypothetical protein
MTSIVKNYSKKLNCFFPKLIISNKYYLIYTNKYFFEAPIKL